ncbi:MAG: hypothetical protein ABJC19_06760 [Gemmatimonadota bacterium]
MLRTRVLAAGLLCFAAACSSSPSGSSSLDAVASLDAATLAADGTAEDVDVMTGMDGGVGYLTTSPLLSYGAGASLLNPPTGRPGFTGCSFAGGSFRCPAENRAGLTVTRVVTLFDALGGVQTTYDEQTTASIHIVASVAGDVTHGPWTATVSRARDFTITGLAGTETSRTVNGSGTEDLSRSRLTDGGEARSYTVQGSFTVTNVVYPVRAPGVDPWPTSGVITRTMVMTRTSGTNTGETRTRTVVITFNGTATPGATVDGVPFTLDLAARHAARR